MRTDEDTICSASALRELAQLVVDNQIDSIHLAEFVRALLCDQLIELHATCRIEAMRISRSGQRRKPAQLAKYLQEQATQLEIAQAASNVAAKTVANLETPAFQSPFSTRPDSSSVAPTGERLTRDRPHPVRFSQILEVIAAVICASLAIALLDRHAGDAPLRVATAIGYAMLAAIYTVAMIAPSFSAKVAPATWRSRWHRATRDRGSPG